MTKPQKFTQVPLPGIVSDQALMLAKSSTPSSIEGVSPMSDTSNSSISNIYDNLNREAAQEARSREIDEFSIANQDVEKVLEREREYKDVEKHWVRRYVWLEVMKEIAKQTRRIERRGVRYLTLPAYYRLDVELFARAGLLEVVEQDNTGQPRELYVAGFERDKAKFGRMAGFTPRFKLFANSTIEKALVDIKNPYYAQLQDIFPFDVVNLDLTTSLTPRHEGPYSETLQAITRVFDLQVGLRTDWALFLTVRNVIEEWNTGTLSQLYKILQINLDEHYEIAQAFMSRYAPMRNPSVLELQRDYPQLCLSQAVVKWVVEMGHHHNFRVKELKVYSYMRHNQSRPSYPIYKYVFVFSKQPWGLSIIPSRGFIVEPWMVTDLVACVQSHKVFDVADILVAKDDAQPGILEELKQDVNMLTQATLQGLQ